MKYCVNCGKEYNIKSGVCPDCLSDQETPNEIIDAALSAKKNKPPHPYDIQFGYPGEKGALIFSIFISVLILLILGSISFGLFWGILIANLIYLKYRHLSSQKNMIRVSDDNFHNTYQVAKIAAFRLKMSLPEIYIVQSNLYNAYTLGFYKYGFVVINSRLISDFNPTQAIFVIGHELGHMKRYHTTWLNLMNPTKVGGAKFVFAPVIKILFNVWGVKAEYTADQAGLIACRDLDNAIKSIVKFAGGSDVEKEVDFDKLIKPQNETAEIVSGLAEYLGTHPFIENRIKQLRVFSSSMEKFDS